MPSRTPKRALAAVFAAVPLVTCVFAVQGVCAEPPADVVVGFVDRPEPGYYSRTVMPTLAAMARAMPDRTVTGVRLSPDDPIARRAGRTIRAPRWIHHSMPVTRFWFDEKANRVVGVQCGRGDKVVNCRARLGVIMATGGITGTPESLDRWVPSVAGKGVVIGGPNNDGSAMLTAVRDVGVPLSHMQYIASYPCGIVTGGRNGPYCRWWFITNQSGILVNKNGKRFVTEKEGICHVTPHLAHNPDGCHCVLADQATWDRTLKTIKLSVLVGLPSWTEERVLKEFELGKNLWKADTLEELCQKSGMNLEGLKGQIELWNKAVETKNDTQFGRTDQQHKIGAGPYRMIRMFPWNNLSCGGVRVTEHFEVLGWDMKPVNGFYAAGEAVAGVHGAFYCGGNACGFAHTSGYMAGKYITGYKEA